MKISRSCPRFSLVYLSCQPFSQNLSLLDFQQIANAVSKSALSFCHCFFFDFSNFFSLFSQLCGLFNCQNCQFIPFFLLMYSYSMKFDFFSLITEKVYFCNNIDQYRLAGLISKVVCNLEKALLVRKYENLRFESRKIFCDPQSQKNVHQLP